MVIDVINTTNKNLIKSNPQTINDIYKQDRLIVDFSDKMKKIDKQIKDMRKYSNIVEGSMKRYVQSKL